MGKPGILILCQLFYPELVSTGQTLTELAEELVSLGVDVDVICGPPTILQRKDKIPKRIEYKGIRIRHVWGTRFPKLNLVGRVINQITFTISAFFYLLFHPSKMPILVGTNPPFLAATCALLRKLRIGDPYVYLIFDVFPDSAVNLGFLKKGGLITRIWDWTNVFIYKYASTIIVIGRCMYHVISKKLDSYGIDVEDKIHNIHVWSDDRSIGSVLGKSNPLLKKWSLEDKFVIGYFGNMGILHDMETIMEAVEILKDNLNIVFLFVGEGRKKQMMINYAKEKGLQNCHFHTYVERKDLGFLMSLADVGLVSLSEGQEGLSVPSKTFGLMAAGVPIVAIMSQVSEIARIINEQKCGIVVRTRDSKALTINILNLYYHKEKLQTMAKNARRAIETKYNLRSAAKAYYQIICNIEKIKEPITEKASFCSVK